MLKRAVDYLILAAIWMTASGGATPAQEPFRTVEGSHLSEKLATASRRSEAESPRTPFWTAYAFDVRTGVGVDIDRKPEFNGRVEAFGGIEVFFGTLNGAPAETRNLGVFTLNRPRSESVTRLEIRNLDKQHPSDGYPVYWLGRATKDESLNQLRGLAESGRSREIRVKAALAVALHDDPRVGGMLKNFVLNSAEAGVRATSISWLGQIKAEREFLADLVRKASETETRMQAVRAITLRKEGDTFAHLRSLYQPDLDSKVKMALIDAIANAREKDAVASCLLDIAEHDPAPDIKQHVVYTLRRFDSVPTIEELMRLYHAEQGESEKQQILYAFSQMSSAHAAGKLFEVARQSNNPRIRRQARFLLNDRISKRIVQATGKTSDRSAEDEFEKVAERILRERSPSEAVTTLIDTAKTNPKARIRMMAIFYLSKIDDPRVLDFYRELLAM